MANLPSTGVNRSSSDSTSSPWLDITKNPQGAWNQVTQPIQGFLDPYAQGINDLNVSRGQSLSLLDAYGDGQRARIDEDFTTKANNAAGGLAARGFGGSSLQLTEAMGVERERQLARGSLEDQIIGQRMNVMSDYSGKIAQAAGQSGDASTSLMRALLGLGQSTQSQSGANNPPPVNYLPGGGGDYGDRVGSGIGDMPRMGEQPVGSGGGGGGGGTRAGSGSGGGGTLGDIANGTSQGSAAGQASKYPPIPPNGPVPLVIEPSYNDPGWKAAREENEKRLEQAQSEGRYVISSGGSGNYQGDADVGWGAGMA